MGLFIPDISRSLERGFLLLFAFLCILAFLIPVYCYHPYERQRDIEDQDNPIERAIQQPYSDENPHSPT